MVEQNSGRRGRYRYGGGTGEPPRTMREKWRKTNRTQETALQRQRQHSAVLPHDTTIQDSKRNQGGSK